MYYYYLLSQKGWSWLIFPDQSKALGNATAAVAGSAGRSEATEALSESHRSLPRENPAVLSDKLDNPEKMVFRIIEVFRSLPTKIVIEFWFYRSKYINYIIKKKVFFFYYVKVKKNPTIFSCTQFQHFTAHNFTISPF